MFGVAHAAGIVSYMVWFIYWPISSIYDERLRSPLSPLLVYFEISISTHRRLNVDCNSRIDVLWPTHTRTPEVDAVVIVLHFCLVFNVISQRLLEQTAPTGGQTKSFVICAGAAKTFSFRSIGLTQFEKNCKF